jgi:hypothetical protein
LQTEPLFEFSSKGFLLGVTEIIEMPEFFSEVWQACRAISAGAGNTWQPKALE